MALRLGTLGRANPSRVKRHGRCANFHSYKDLMGDARCLLELPETCRSQPRTALALSTRHHNNKWPECNYAPAMCVFKFLLIAKLQQHDPAREPGLHFAASPNAPRRVQYVLRLSSFQLYQFYYEELKKAPGLPTRALFNNRKAPSFSA